MTIKLVLFDMDGTLLEGRTIQKFAEEKNFKKELNQLLKSKKKFYEITIEIAKLLKDMQKEDLLKIFREIPIQRDTEFVIQELKKLNIKTAIITDSYKFLAEDLKKRLDIDYTFANNLISKNGVFTGEVFIHNKKYQKDPINSEIYSICKSCILDILCKKFKIKKKEVIAIGDGIVDIGMLNQAGVGIAFKAPEIVKKYANVRTNKLIDILKYI